MQIFMGQAWLDHSADFHERALRSDRITFCDLGIVLRIGKAWTVEHVSPEASSFIAIGWKWHEDGRRREVA